jgi:hypothetical protein
MAKTEFRWSQTLSGRPAEVGRRLRARNTWADRTSLVLYNETDAGAVVDVVRAFKAK